LRDTKRYIRLGSTVRREVDGEFEAREGEKEQAEDQNGAQRAINDER
jgi:hypothetical protein